MNQNHIPCDKTDHLAKMLANADTSSNPLVLLELVAAEMIAAYSTLDKHRVSKYISSYPWKALRTTAEEITGKKISWHEGRGSTDQIAAYSIASAFLKETQNNNWGSLSGEAGLFGAFSNSNYWHWSLIAEAAASAKKQKQFPIIGAEPLIEAIRSLRSSIPSFVLNLFRVRLEKAATSESQVRELIENNDFLTRYLEPIRKYRAHNQSLENLLRNSATTKELSLFTEHGLLLFVGEPEKDLKEATLRFNRTLLLDWQLVETVSAKVRQAKY